MDKNRKHKPSRRRLTGCRICLIVSGVILAVAASVVAGLFDWMLHTAVKKLDRIGLTSDGDFTWSAQNWASPHFNEHMNFYMFNVENPHEVVFDGKKPYLNERGPYSFRQTDIKHNISFSANGSLAVYWNYRTWYWDQSTSCTDCYFNDTVTVPNLVLLGAIAQMQKMNVSADQQKLADTIFLLLNEQPFVTVPVGEILFTGYPDALLSLESFLSKFGLLKNMTGGQEIPPKMAFFYGYNHSHDGEYEVHTGAHQQVDRIGDVVQWEHHRVLPQTWWSNDSARQIRGSDGGQVRPPFMDENRSPEIFLTYWCRSFNLQFDQYTKVRDIDGIRYKIPRDVFNVSAPGNEAFVDPHRPNLPEGLMSIPCQPGKRIEIGLPTVYSAPHFLDCAPEAKNSVENLSPPDREKHSLGSWTFQSLIGYPIRILFRQQINIPFEQNPNFIMMSKVRSLNLPLLWIEEDVMVDDETRTTVLLVQYAPLVLQIVLYVLIAVGVLMVLIPIAYTLLRKRPINKTHPEPGEDPSESVAITEAEQEKIGVNENDEPASRSDSVRTPDEPNLPAPVPALRRSLLEADSSPRPGPVLPSASFIPSSSSELESTSASQQAAPDPNNKHQVVVTPEQHYNADVDSDDSGSDSSDSTIKAGPIQPANGTLASRHGIYPVAAVMANPALTDAHRDVGTSTQSMDGSHQGSSAAVAAKISGSSSISSNYPDVPLAETRF